MINFGRRIKWMFHNFTLASQSTSGISIFRAGGGGTQHSFDGGSNDEWSGNFELDNGAAKYNGSDMEITVEGQLSTTPAAGKNIKFGVQYLLTAEGDDSDAAGTTFEDTFNLDGKVSGEIIKFVLPTKITGNELKKDMQISIRRHSAGAGSDTYNGSIWVTDIKIKGV